MEEIWAGACVLIREMGEGEKGLEEAVDEDGM